MKELVLNTCLTSISVDYVMHMNYYQIVAKFRNGSEIVVRTQNPELYQKLFEEAQRGTDFEIVIKPKEKSHTGEEASREP